MSLCERPGCSQPGAAAYGMVAEELTFWIDHLNDAVFAGVLCGKHADTLSVPRGWTLIDRRDPDLHLFSLRSSKAIEPTARTARSSAHAPGEGVEQLQIDCGFDRHRDVDPVASPTDQVESPPEPTSVVATTPVVALSDAAPPVDVGEPLGYAEPSTGSVEASAVPPLPTGASTPSGDDQLRSDPRHEPVATERRVEANAETGVDQLAFALDPALTVHAEPAGNDQLTVAPTIQVQAVEPPAADIAQVAFGGAPDFPPPIVVDSDLADVDRNDNDELPVPNELLWLDRYDGPDAGVVAPPPGDVEHSDPTDDRSEKDVFGDETGAADPKPWMPTFDHNDDLDGMLDATSPLLRRAFHGDDIS